MIKSGLIVGGVMLLLSLGVGLVSPLCSICVAVLAGLGAGYLANVYENPAFGSGAPARGAGAGAIAGAIAILGQIIAAVINSSQIDPALFTQMFGDQGLTDEQLQVYLTIGQYGGAFCIGLLNLALMAGLGALGGVLWRQRHNNQMNPPMTPPPAYPQ